MAISNEVIGNRIKLLRLERKETQREFAAGLAKLLGKDKPYSEMAVSCWETGRKAPPLNVFIAIGGYFDVSLDYLMGVGGRYSPQMSVGTISLSDIASYDGKPVYVSFPDGDCGPCFGIVDAIKNIIRLKDRDVVIDERIVMREYVDPSEVTLSYRASHLLTLKEVLALDYVFVESMSGDPFVRGVIDGWYYHSLDRTCLMNSRGNVLSYDTLGVTYNARAFKNERVA